VARFKAAGGIALMKTNLPEFSGWTESDNRVTGRTNNPWNLERTPGGSSGGESAALAAGMSPIGIGSDVMISVRGPAAFTGVAALKATHGRVPYTGHYPSIISHWWHVGAMARTIGDVALGYSILKGPDGIDGYAIHARDAESGACRIAGQPIRVGWVSDAAFGPVDPEITAAVAAAAVQLADLGCLVEEVTLPFLGNPFGTMATLVYGEIVPMIKSLSAGREDQSAYGSAANLAWLVEERQIEPHIPVFDKSNRTDGTFSRSDFVFDAERNHYTCPQGKLLVQFRRTFATPRSGITKEGTRLYRSSKSDCQDCAFKAKCCPNTPQRKVPRDLDEDARDVARSLATTPAYERSRHRRKKIEMLFAHLKRILRLGRPRLRGPSGARDEFLLAATAQNLRKLAKLRAMPAACPVPA
jgi:hypothetical protein